MSRKFKLNFIIDILMLVIMAAIAGLGFLMKYILIPGKDRWIKYSNNVDLYFLGLDRHEWGTIHLVLGFILLGLLILHIILHWKTIKCFFRECLKNLALRRFFIIIFITLCFILFLFPFAIRVEVVDIPKGQGHHNAIVAIQPDTMNIDQNEKGQKDISIENKMQNKFIQKNLNDAETKHHHNDYGIDIRGYMTLDEVSKKYKIPSNYLKKKLNIASGISGQINLGWLRKKYHFKMSDIEKIIIEYKDNNKK